MKQSLFESRYQASWERFAARLEQLEARQGWRKRKAGSKPAEHADFSAAYRQLCQQLALARERGYSSHLVDPLQQLAMRGHQQLYRRRGHVIASLLNFLLAEFPRRVRAERRFVFIAGGMLYASMIGMGLLVYLFPDLIYSIVDPSQVSEMESMYEPAAQRLGRAAIRGSSDDLAMFGFYIMNNIGIGFQTFSSGMLFGVGSLFYLLFNGLMIGAVAGHLTDIGYVQTFWPFVLGHGAFELNAIALSGAAGLKLGWALLVPGRLSRSEALRIAAAQSMPLVYGVIVFLLIAAFIEAYWSSMTVIGPTVKYCVAAGLWTLVTTYLLFAGGSGHAPD